MNPLFHLTISTNDQAFSDQNGGELVGLGRVLKDFGDNLIHSVHAGERQGLLRTPEGVTVGEWFLRGER